MSAPSTAKSYSQLSPEQKGFVESKRIEATHTPDEWVALLADVASFDQAGDQQRTKVGWGCGTSVILTIICIAVFPPISPLPLVASIALTVLFLRAKKRDVPNQLRESVLPLVALLREDYEPGSPLTLTIDLRPADRKENEQSSRDMPGSGFPKVSETTYLNGWLAGKGTLADGTTLEWEIADDIRERKVTKRNPRGKIKVKRKYKVRRAIEMRLGMRNDSYQWNPVGQPQGTLRMKHKEGEKRNVVKVRRQSVLTGTQNPSLDVRDVIDTLAGAYRRVNLVQEGN